MLTQDKISEIFCTTDDFYKEYAKERHKRHFYQVMEKAS